MSNLMINMVDKKNKKALAISICIIGFLTALFLLASFFDSKIAINLSLIIAGILGVTFARIILRLPINLIIWIKKKTKSKHNIL